MKTKNLTQLINECEKISELSVKFNSSYEMYYRVKSEGLVRAGGYLHVASKIFEKIADTIGWSHAKPLVNTNDFPVNEKKMMMSMHERALYLLRSSLDLREYALEIPKMQQLKDIRDPEKYETIYNLFVEALNSLMRASFFIDEALYFVETATIKTAALASGGNS